MRYDLDRAGTRELMNGREMQNMVEWAADLGAGVAKAAAPEATGELKSKIKGTAASPNGGAKRDRAEAFIESNADHTAATEFGNSRSAARHYLQAGLDAINSGG